jgi:tetratricopeptide (TPR) repeat protein
MTPATRFAIHYMRLNSLLLAVLAAGCSGGAHPEQIASAEAAYTTGIEAFDAGRYDEAAQRLSEALDGGGLNADMYSDAHLHRALARMELQDYAAAMQDLDVLEQGAPDLDRVYRARAQVYLKQGDREQAAEAFHQARNINPAIEKPEGL